MGDNMSLIIDQYIEQGNKYIEVIKDALTKDDSKAIREAAHPLRSSSNQVGATKLGKVCDYIEEEAKNGKSKEIESEILNAIQLFSISCQRFKELGSI